MAILWKGETPSTPTQPPSGFGIKLMTPRWLYIPHAKLMTGRDFKTLPSRLIFPWSY
jgi:hypothetical protein